MKNVSLPIPYLGNTSVGNFSNVPRNGVGTSLPTCDFSKTDHKGIWLSVFLLFVMCANLVGNFLVIFACVRSSQLKKRKNSLFLVSLAFSDLTYGVCVIPWLVSLKLHMGTFCHSLAACYFLQIMDVMANASSIIILFIIAVDRFIAITMPYRYQAILTAKSAKWIVAGCWIFAIIWSFIGIFKWGKKQQGSTGIWSIVIVPNDNFCHRSENSYYFAASFIGIYMIPLLIMTVTYSMVLTVAFTQIKAIETTTVDASTFSPPDGGQKRGKSQVARKRQKELKATKSVATVYFCFLICWFPLLVINTIALFDPSIIQKESPSVKDFLVYAFVDILPSLNTMVNPIIYCFVNAHFREGYKAAFKKCLGRSLNRRKSESTFTRSITRIMSITSLNVDTNIRPHNARNDQNISLPTIKEKSGNYLTPESAQSTTKSVDNIGTHGLENPTFDPS